MGGGEPCRNHRLRAYFGLRIFPSIVLNGGQRSCRTYLSPGLREGGSGSENSGLGVHAYPPSCRYYCHAWPARLGPSVLEKYVFLTNCLSLVTPLIVVADRRIDVRFFGHYPTTLVLPSTFWCTMGLPYSLIVTLSVTPCPFSARAPLARGGFRNSRHGLISNPRSWSRSDIQRGAAVFLRSNGRSCCFDHSD